MDWENIKLANKPFISLYWLATILLILMTQSCALIGIGNDDQGEARGVPGRSDWRMTTPLDMVLVPGGSFMMGEVDDDIAAQITPNRQVTVSDYFMDATEITNNKYRQFINTMLAEPPDTIDETFVMTKLYPDTNVWRNDFSHHMADPIVENYYEHPAYDDFPVVGISWEAARHYAEWRSEYLNEYREQKGLPPYPRFSLPSAAQWEYAARGGKELAKYPWGGPYIRDSEGKLRANFKSGSGNYDECGYAYTSPVREFAPNDYGLYDMAGNVAEWTLDVYNPASVSRTSDLNPVYLDDAQPMKIIKGGSWKDISRFLQTGMNDYEHKDSVRSYIGFRCVIPYIGSKSK